jgi:hypothetical protein
VFVTCAFVLFYKWTGRPVHLYLFFKLFSNKLVEVFSAFQFLATVMCVHSVTQQAGSSCKDFDFDLDGAGQPQL